MTLVSVALAAMLRRPPGPAQESLHPTLGPRCHQGAQGQQVLRQPHRIRAYMLSRETHRRKFRRPVLCGYPLMGLHRGAQKQEGAPLCHPGCPPVDVERLQARCLLLQMPPHLQQRRRPTGSNHSPEYHRRTIRQQTSHGDQNRRKSGRRAWRLCLKPPGPWMCPLICYHKQHLARRLRLAQGHPEPKYLLLNKGHSENIREARSELCLVVRKMCHCCFSLQGMAQMRKASGKRRPLL